MRLAYLGLFSVPQISIPEVAKIVMDRRAESCFGQISLGRLTKWSNIDCKYSKKFCLKLVPEQFYITIKLEEIFYFVTKRIPYLYVGLRFVNTNCISMKKES